VNLVERVTAAARPTVRDNETTALSIRDWARQFQPGSQVNYQGRNYQAFQLTGTSPGHGLYESNSIVFACEAKRLSVFSEARFVFQQLRNGRPADLFGTPDLAVFEEPWPGATTRDLLAVSELDVATYGNSYWVLDPDGYLQWLDPCNVKILTEGVEDPVSGVRIGERLLGYAYLAEPGKVALFDPQEIAHYKGTTPSRNRFLGQSWLSACLPDVDADNQMTEHKRVQLRNGANLSVVVSLSDQISPDDFSKFVDRYRESHEGPVNSGKTLFLGGGADVKTVGQTFENLALKATQGATETRIAACAQVHPVIVGLSEGMQGSSLNAGNYGAAKKNWVDSGMKPLWGAWAGAFKWVVKVPSGARLWYDDRDIAFLREDVKDQADIFAKDAQSIQYLINAGYEPDAIIRAVKANDIQQLIANHTGLFSVQLQPPNSGEPAMGANQLETP
jgi:hypothetical protein